MKMASFSSLKIVEGPSFVSIWFDKTKIDVPGFKIRKLASKCRLVESGLTLSKLSWFYKAKIDQDGLGM